jgi:biopolymer transport protein ExbB/TolQ
MKILLRRQIQIIALIAMFLGAFTQTCFSQALVAKTKQDAKIQYEINSKNVDKAYFKRRPFWVAGGFWGFLIWVLILFNTIMFCASAISSWIFIRHHRAYPRELVHKVKSVLYDDSLGFAMEACSPCKTPLGRILFSSFKNIADGFDVCKDEMVIAVKAEHERMLKGARLLLNCAIYSAVLGFLGSGMVLFNALRDFSMNSDAGNWQELAYTCSQSFYPLLTGFAIAYIAFWFHKYCLGKINRIIINTEKIAYDLIKILRGINLEEDMPDLPTMTRLLNPSSVVSLSKNKIVSKENKSKEN